MPPTATFLAPPPQNLPPMPPSQNPQNGSTAEISQPQRRIIHLSKRDTLTSPRNNVVVGTNRVVGFKPASPLPSFESTLYKSVAAQSIQHQITACTIVGNKAVWLGTKEGDILIYQFATGIYFIIIFINSRNL